MAWSSAAAFWEWTETFERASCSLCHRLQGLDSNLPTLVAPPTPTPSTPCLPTHLSSPSVKMTLHWTVGLRRSECTAVTNFPRGHVTHTHTHTRTVSKIQVLHKHSRSNQIPNNTQGFTLFSAGNSALCSFDFLAMHTPTHVITAYVPIHTWLQRCSSCLDFSDSDLKYSLKPFVSGSTLR